MSALSCCRSVDSSSEPGRGAAQSRARPARAVFGLHVRLLNLVGMWPPPASAPAPRRNLYGLYSALMWLFTLAAALGEIGGLLVVPGSLEKKCQSMCSSLLRLAALFEFTLCLRHARPIQALVEELERFAIRKHQTIASEQVERLKERARGVINRLMLVYAAWFTYSSTGVVLQPVVDWHLAGRRPKPFLASNFWLLVEADTPGREAFIYLLQSASQYTCGIIVATYTTFFASMAIYISYQAEILCVLLETVPLSKIRGHPQEEERIRSQVVTCIKFHQDILKLCRLFLMVLFFLCLAFIATMIYQLAVVPPTNATFMATFMIFICSNSLVGVNCYGSDRLQQATAEVVHRVMAMDWAAAPVPVQSLLRFMISRACRPPALWCWTVFSISLPTWLQVLNKAYSVFAVMRSSDK